MKAILKVLIGLLFGAAIPLQAQVAPEATSPRTIPINGNLSYSARYSQTDQSYPGGVGGQEAIVSGDFAYSTNSERKPFSITFGGGDSWVLSGTAYNSGPYENLTLTQGLVAQRWSIQLSDNVSYRTGAPIVGFAGEAGSGETSTGPTQPPGPTDETVLTLNASVVNNTVNGEYNYKLNPFSTVSAGGGYSVLNYPNNNGIDIDNVLANVEWTQRLNARNTLVGQYAYSHFTYPDAGASFNMNTPTVQWQHTWTRTITSNISVGPQWLTPSGSGSTGTGQTGIGPVQSSTGVSIDTSIADNTHLGAATVAYDHGTNGGGGYLIGGKMDSVTAAFNHQFGRQVTSQLSLEFTGGYRHNSSLISPTAGGGGGTGIGVFTGDISSEYGSVQATRALGRNFSVNASFTGTEQSFGQSTQPTGTALNGLWRVISFGFGYTPQPIHLRH
jgi:hypothetical protein